MDPSALIPMEKQHAAGRTTLLKQGPDLFISAVTLSELLVGVYRSDAKRQPLRRRFVDELLNDVTVLPFDQAVAVRHAEMVAELRAKGLTVGIHDMLIAATAVHHGLDVMTLDMRSFPFIPGVRLVPVP